MLTQIIGFQEFFIYCLDSLTIEQKNGAFVVKACRGIMECFGCHPIGAWLPFDPKRITDHKQVLDAMMVKEEELNGVWLTKELISKYLKAYEESAEHWYWYRTISCDLDSVFVFRLACALGEK